MNANKTGLAVSFLSATLFLLILANASGVSAQTVEVIDIKGKAYQVKDLNSVYRMAVNVPSREYPSLDFRAKEGPVTERIEIPFTEIKSIQFEPKGGNIDKSWFDAEMDMTVKKRNGSTITYKRQGSKRVFEEIDKAGAKIRTLTQPDICICIGGVRGDFHLEGFTGKSETKGGLKGTFYMGFQELSTIVFP